MQFGKSLLKHVYTRTFKSSLTCSIFAFTLLMIFFVLDWKRMNVYPRLDEIPGLNVLRAWDDLQEITKSPHPYNSHASDVVRNYILEELYKLKKQDEGNVEVIDDLSSTTTFIMPDTNIRSYFEGSNILVRFRGDNERLRPILLSSHFDSVSTGFGATDNGMGVASALELARYYAEHKPERDLIINFNNAEEDYLYGARAFTEHEWSKNVTAFLNLEGAGAGGKALLFRSTNNHVARSYFKSNRFAFASVLGIDAFKRGVIKSETDYVVYEKMNNGTAGLDLAFFRNRGIYHTERDDIQHTSIFSLNHMLVNAFISLRNLLDEKSQHFKGSSPLYFPVFGSYWQINLNLHLFLNVVFLIACPAILFMCLFRFPSLYAQLKKPCYLICFTLSSLFVLIFDYVVVQSLTKLNPYVIHSSPDAVLAFFFLTNLLGLVYSFRYVATHSRMSNEELSCIEIVLIWYVSMFWYISLLIATLTSIVRGLGSLYFVNFGFFCSFFCCILTLIRVRYFVDRMVTINRPANPEQMPLVQSTSGNAYGTSRYPQHRLKAVVSKSASVKLNDNLWSVLFFSCLVPLPLFTCYNLLSEVFIPAVHQSLIDGPYSNTCYKFAVILVFMAIINSSPFVFRALSKKSSAILLMLWVSLLFNILRAEPFNEKAPIKFRVFQHLNLDTSENLFHVQNIEPYTQKVLNDYPKIISDTSYQCVDRDCFYEAEEPTLGFDGPLQNAINITLHKSLNSSLAELRVDAFETKWCYFDFSVPVYVDSINGFEVQEEHQSLRLGVRNFGTPFVVKTVAKDEDSPTNVTVTCMWDEFDHDKIPSYTSLLNYIPAWSVLTKNSTGLLKMSKTHVM
ncbi:aminopeptidase [Schizosaccharomyces japonicus yFS275]|uniref:Vacuolar membrane protease n=1 Tax=Schizosaccharomyces japonicus (strain yFS275 / FY16936) TaxID=402676 RepID=PFF1_SCHJY|nr:aminopeptidase [Schizosaccharomyces japonicus yFS275]B6K327.1 RecName: Full=Vacuolar membrane protease; AltName: Full=FXNA-related family protease 1 [Schizosaccharomyces japonicus yFS275]EEB07884.1 aminopeptidase [Schizosaccharomyces japonicus yFS275]